MELHEVLTSRRSCRSFLPDPIAPDRIDRVLATALRGPSAGNSWAIDMVVLDDPVSVERYWSVSLPAGPARESFAWPGLLAAPVLVLVAVEPDAYVRRYAEADKARTGLGSGAEVWPVPYWWVDAGAAIMAVLLAATDDGLGSLLFGTFDHEPALRDAFGVPVDRRLVATVALGVADPSRSSTSTSAARRRPSLKGIVHHGRW